MQQVLQVAALDAFARMAACDLLLGLLAAPGEQTASGLSLALAVPVHRAKAANDLRAPPRVTDLFAAAR